MDFSRLLAELHHSRGARIRVAGGGAGGDAPDAQASAWGFPYGQPQPPKCLSRSWDTTNHGGVQREVSIFPARSPGLVTYWHRGPLVEIGPRSVFSNSAVNRSIFSICNALHQGGLLTLPDVPPSVCYPSGRHRQRRRPKPGGQRNLDPRIGRERASRHGDCQHHGGRGPAVRDRSTQVKC